MTVDSTSAPAGDAPEAAISASEPPPKDDSAGPSPLAAEPAKGRGIRFWLKWGAIGAVALGLAALIGGYFLPRSPEVTRSVDIALPRAAVFPLVADLRRLADWSPWLAADPDIAITFTGPLDGVGQTVTWESKRAAVGAGAATITAIALDEAVEMRVTRAGHQAHAAWFRLAEKGAGETTVLWGYRTDLGFNPVDRYRGLALDGAIGPDYERGLARLKAVAETPPKSDSPAAN